MSGAYPRCSIFIPSISKAIPVKFSSIHTPHRTCSRLPNTKIVYSDLIRSKAHHNQHEVHRNNHTLRSPRSRNTSTSHRSRRPRDCSRVSRCVDRTRRRCNPTTRAASEQAKGQQWWQRELIFCCCFGITQWCADGQRIGAGCHGSRQIVELGVDKREENDA